MVFARISRKYKMRTSSVLLVILLIITFPIWLGIAGGLIGLAFGLIGGAIGIVVGVFGAVLGAIGAMIGAFFEVLFGDWRYTHVSPFWIAVGVIILAVAVRSRRQTR
jgi:energy-converting hydrogenase Eha subunit A